MKQTAVEWLIEQMYKECINVFTDKEIEQAKEMEKEQIIEAFKEGVEYWNGDEWKLIDIEDYYIKTYKK
jgi:hypothetical protein